MGIQSGSGNLAVFLTFVLVGFLAQKFNWQVSLFFCSGVCFLLGTISFLLVRNLSFRTDDLEPLDFSSWLETVKKIRTYVIGFIFGGACWSVTIYFGPSLLNHKFNISMGNTGLYLALWIGIGTIITYSFGPLSRKYGRSRIYKTGFIGASLSLFLLGVSNKPLWAILSLFLFGMFLFLLYPALQSYVGNTVPSKNQPQAFSLVSNLQMISGAVISLLAGILSDRFGIASPFLVMGLLGIGASLFYLVPLIKLNSSKV